MTKRIDKELLERKVILQQAAARGHLPEYAVEKDWWVSMIGQGHFIWRGLKGTSN